MTTPRVSQSSSQRIARPLTVAILIALPLSLLPIQAFAQEGGTVVGPYIVTLQPGETMNLCYNELACRKDAPEKTSAPIPAGTASPR